MRQSAYKPGSGWHADCYTRLRDGHSSWTPVTRRLQQPTRTAGSGHRSRRHALAAPHRPYSVLLPVGFAVPPALPPARCALTAPFHPCCAPPVRVGRQRSVFCGTFPRLAPAGRYPAPLVHGARTFLPVPLPSSPRKWERRVEPERPSGRLTTRGMGRAAGAVKRRGARTPWLAPRCCAAGRAGRADRARSGRSRHRPGRRPAAAGSGAGRPSPRRASRNRRCR
jgi:hypothetical protein